MSQAFSINSVYQYDFDRAISARFAPHDKKRGLLLLSCFDHELEKIRYQTSDPLLRRIRTQFWIDALDEPSKHGHELVKALMECVSSNAAVREGLVDLITVYEKYQSEATTPEIVLAETVERQSQMFKLVYNYCSSPPQQMSDEFFQRCGAAYGGIRALCRNFGSGHQDDEWTEKNLDTSRAAHEGLYSELAKISPSDRSALLPLALVLPYLNLYQTSDGKDRKPIDLHPARKVWIIWRTARNGF